ncbi:MAG: PorT family protein [Bacteroides sp.]|nr:PorT family protein [Bacteroides sp.]MDE7461881.1 PorT family protein [Muribaculaceae bacterium]
MKKILLLALSLFAGVSAVSAANPIVDNPNNKPYVGVRLNLESNIPGNVNFSNTSVNAFNPGAGISVGAIYNRPIIANFYVEPGLELYYNTQKFNTEDDLFQNSQWEHNSVRSFGMRVPVMLGYHFDFSPKVSLAVATGPVLKVGFTEDYYLTTKTKVSDDVAFRNHYSGSLYKDSPFAMAGPENARNRVDCAWRFSIGVNFLKHYYAGLSGEVGMVNRIKHTNNGAYSQHDNLFQLNLGYNF